MVQQQGQEWDCIRSKCVHLRRGEEKREGREQAKAVTDLVVATDKAIGGDVVLAVRLPLTGGAPHGRAHLGVDLRRVVKILRKKNMFKGHRNKTSTHK